MIRETSDQIMRRVLNSIDRTAKICNDDANALNALRSEQSIELSSAEKEARTLAERFVPPRVEDFRRSLVFLPTSQPVEISTGVRPQSIDDAISEWNPLFGDVSQQVETLVEDFKRWKSKLFKRRSSAPTVPDALWRKIDRLAELHRMAPELRESYIADQVRRRSDAARVVLEAEGVRRIEAQSRLFEETRSIINHAKLTVGATGAAWSDPKWNTVTPAAASRRFIHLGEFEPRLPSASGVGSVPVVVDYPFVGGVALEATVDDRHRATEFARSLILRILAATPPGAVEFVMFDPVAIGRTVAEFRHLAEFDVRLVDTKTWTAERDIERRLDELSDHLEVVISNYLRGQFESIDEYNEHAGEVAEPYRVLVVLDYPIGFSEKASRQLLSLVENGPRCGVHTVVQFDPKADFSQVVPPERLTHSMQVVSWRGERATMRLADPIGPVDAEIIPDSAPPLEFDAQGQPRTSFARLLVEIGEASRQEQAAPVTIERLFPVLNALVAAGRSREIPDLKIGDQQIDPGDSRTWWQGNTTMGASAPIGRAGAQDVASLNFSSTDVAGGAIMVGLPRSGKSTALHAAITSLSIIYPPGELELYLIDSKHGVEFKAYENLPHAQMVSIRSEREFAVAVLRSLDSKIKQRAELMKAVGAGMANITEYREVTGEIMPRVILFMDEFHEVFEEDDDLGRSAFQSFSNIVRQGPFAGVHVVVSSQTLSSMPAMDRPTLSLLPMRVAFMCDESDAHIVMGDHNREVLALSKKGQGIYNPVRGNPAYNKAFQGMYIDPSERTQLLEEVRRLAVESGFLRTPHVFDGDLPAKRPQLSTEEVPSWRLTLSLGESYDLDQDPTIALARSRGSNVLLMGQAGEVGFDPAFVGVVHSCVAQASAQGAHVTLVDLLGEESDSSEAIDLPSLCEGVGARYERQKKLDEVVLDLSRVVSERHENGKYRENAEVLILHGLQRAIDLAPEDPYPADEDDASPQVGAMLSQVVRDGPEVGAFVVVSSDNMMQFDRRIGRDMLKEFECRVLSRDATSADVATATDSFKESEIRPHQLLVADHSRGTSRRMRGYLPYSMADAPTGGNSHGR